MAMDISDFLALGIQFARALSRLHRDNVVHQNIRPENIRFDPTSKRVELLRAASALESAQPRFAHYTGLPLAVLPYISPEQTGRMNRPIDHRSDLYSAGVVFYEMLCDKLPYSAEDTLGWIHCHIAVLAQPLSAVARDVPLVVSSIVAKLLAKVAEDRYQSARGLELDLKRCIDELTQHGRIEPFPLAQHDIWDRLQVPAKLYGREREIATLVGAFERVVATGTAGIALVSGYSGIGKSSLINELHKSITRERGFFISGKFDQYKKDIPYFTIHQAFKELIRQILGESEERLLVWRRRLTDALGTSAALVVEVIPPPYERGSP